MKLKPVYEAFAAYDDIEQFIIHSGQHYSDTMSAQFIQELDLPEPDYNLGITHSAQAGFIGSCMTALAETIDTIEPDAIIVYGDTNTTLAGAMVGAKSNILTIHIEAGLREHQLDIPEEVNKRAIDAISDVLFAPSQQGLDQLHKEHVLGKTYFVGDVTLDLLRSLETKIDSKWQETRETFALSDTNYVLLTCHRANNTDNRTNLEAILKAVAQIDRPIIFPIHPRTHKAIKTFGLNDYLNAEHIQAVEPLPYLATQALIKHAAYCITDSGGIIKEAYFHGKSAIIIDRQTEWTELIDAGLHQLTGANTDTIIDACKRMSNAATLPNLYGNGTAAKQIAEIVRTLLSE